MRCCLWKANWLVPLLLWQVLGTEADAIGGCWSKNDCIIRALLHETNAAPTDPGYPIEINCMREGVSDEQRTAIANSRILELDGVQCYTIQDSYGFEYIPNCNEVVQVTVRRFNSDTLQPFQCPLALSAGGDGNVDLSLKVIVFTGNDINTISAESLSGNYGHLRELHFRGNNLRHVYQHAFDLLRSVEVLTFEQEPQLMLKDAHIVEQMNVELVKFEGLKLITAQIFQHLPLTLKELSVMNTEVSGHRAEFSEAFGQMHTLDTLTLANCKLEAFVISDKHWQIRAINLSGNALVELQLGNASASKLESLDLSGNKLTHLPMEWLQALSDLRHLYLQGNYLTTISIRQLIEVVPTLLAVDVRDNRLTALSDESVDFDFEQMPRVRIDRNPWNCIALQNLAQTHPEKFRFFQYDKFISQINVNGLACDPTDTPTTTQNVVVEAAVAGDASSISPPTNTTFGVKIRPNAPQHKGLPYNDYEHRSQRTEALIIVFMLPLGIAILFVILYMWIYCEKIFHLSYYRCAFPPFKRRAATPVKASERRADIVRHIPPGTTAVGCGTVAVNDGYELPLNGIPNCNCHTLGAQKCQKRHHLTYVTLPPERPYLIYEEIVEDTNVPAPQEPGYDHLTFVGPIDANTM